jgi:hypothetical protein
VEFGSKEYFALAGDPEARPFLQGGPNVVFTHQGKVVSVQDAGSPIDPSGSVVGPDSVAATHQAPGNKTRDAASLLLGALMMLLDLFGGFTP